MNWIVLKSVNFQFETAVIGTSVGFQDICRHQFFDYHVSDESLKSLASMFVVSKFDSKHIKHIELLWRDRRHSNFQCFDLIDDGEYVGAIIVCSASDPAVHVLGNGNKLSQHLSLSSFRKIRSNNKTRIIVNLTALGLSTGEISHLMNLTSRGVDYHLEKAKQRLGATNKANLVFKANQYGWL
ncbi:MULTISPECIES: LuxR C-terminal-related transcriptional regulator [Ferrimonas]|uniref:helix-turn-helix transcriptional regulator n=1 Tax=Ferrimonas TaxID=44011 RepID=UPI00146DA6FD|nr:MULTISPECIES: LuxR C-terminal-related transcriptional regulator [Ferrimonas]USD37313.1 helix-turn-helix transcriptional regulator [Ferrimonas sp. SCSIO 43195]